MPTPQELADQRREVQALLLKHIQGEKSTTNIERLALAYRYLDGGSQPGGHADTTK